MVVLVGYSDGVGASEANRVLAQKRAEHVRDVLVEAGADRSRLEVISRGSADPIADNGNEAGRKLNRRVMVECRPR
jgi:outer membrane protein OmpA-like peptidoglycan-associated protein